MLLVGLAGFLYVLLNARLVRGMGMDRTYLIKPVIDAEYPMIDYGKGVYLYDSEGRNISMLHLEQLRQISVMEFRKLLMQ